MGMAGYFKELLASGVSASRNLMAIVKVFFILMLENHVWSYLCVYVKPTCFYIFLFLICLAIHMLFSFILWYILPMDLKMLMVAFILFV